MQTDAVLTVGLQPIESRLTYQCDFPKKIKIKIEIGWGYAETPLALSGCGWCLWPGYSWPILWVGFASRLQHSLMACLLGSDTPSIHPMPGWLISSLAKLVLYSSLLAWDTLSQSYWISSQRPSKFSRRGQVNSPGSLPRHRAYEPGPWKRSWSLSA